MFTKENGVEKQIIMLQTNITIVVVLLVDHVHKYGKFQIDN